MTISYSSASAQPAVHLPGLARRCFDIIVASLAIAVFSAFIALISVVIWIESGRPIFFQQARIGRDGRRFIMFKFRKFRPDAGTAGCPLTVSGDARMTRVGKLLMKTKLDELPQLWNVLRGDMSIVGPRPESYAFSDCFTGGFERLLEYKPGLLGPSQVAFRHEGDLFPEGIDPEQYYRARIFPAKAMLDLTYYQNRTVWSDITWIIRGVLTVLGLKRVAPQHLTNLPGEGVGRN